MHLEQSFPSGFNRGRRVGGGGGHAGVQTRQFSRVAATRSRRGRKIASVIACEAAERCILGTRGRARNNFLRLPLQRLVPLLDRGHVSSRPRYSPSDV